MVTLTLSAVGAVVSVFGVISLMLALGGFYAVIIGVDLLIFLLLMMFFAKRIFGSK